MSEFERDTDFFVPSSRAKNRWTIVPRVLLMDTKGNIPLLPHRDRYGLFGGHIKLKEFNAIEGLNLLNPATTFPTLSREVTEEAKIDIRQHLLNMACLGIAEIEQLDLTRARHASTTDILVPIFLSITPKISYPDHVYMTRLDDLPKSLYPDAALALWHVRRNKRNHTKGPIFPAWLNQGRHVVYVKSDNDSFVKYFH